MAGQHQARRRRPGVIVPRQLRADGSPASFDVRNPVRMRSIVGAAGSMVDAALVSALRSKNMSIVERMEARAVRALLYAGMWSALKEWEREDGGSGATTD